MNYYKATRPDGTSFYDGTTLYEVGSVVKVPGRARTLCAPGILHVSDAPGESLVGGRWPCRLFEVEPGPIVASDGHKHGTHRITVLAELPATQALGPNGEAVAALIERCRTMTATEAKQLAVAWGAAQRAARVAAWGAARDAAWGAVCDAARGAICDAAWGAVCDAAWGAVCDAARDAAWGAAQRAAQRAARDAARDAVCDAAWGAALALLVRDLITPAQFDLLYGPWASVMGKSSDEEGL